jgi:hypothetical protein
MFPRSWLPGVRRSVTIVLALSALAAGGAVAAVIAPARAASRATVTLGTTLGTPATNICAVDVDCTYVPFEQNASNPELEVPADGTVTSFSVNAGSATGSVELRVLRPAGSGEYTGAGTSPAESLTTTGVSTFTVSLPVEAGDVLALDNSSSAILFDDSSGSATDFAEYYNPALADGATGAPTATDDGYRLLVSATVEEAASTTTSTTTTATTTTTTTTTTSARPSLTHVAQSHRAWREGTRLPKLASASGSPVGTTFSFTLNERAKVRFAFSRLVAGRKVNQRCVPPSRHNRHRPACARSVGAGTLSFSAAGGPHRLAFQGRLSRKRRLAAGSYRLAITASTANGLRSKTATLRFTIRAH